MKCVCVWLGAGWEVKGLGFTKHVETGGVLDVCLCLSWGDAIGVGGGWGLGQGLEVCGGGISVCVMSLDYVCRWKV